MKKFFNSRTCRKVLSERSLNCGDRRGKYVNPLEASSDVKCYQVLTLKTMFCSLSAFAGFVWISKKEAIISLPNMLVFITEIQCLLPGTT
jgi:hypothetical protein